MIVKTIAAKRIRKGILLYEQSVERLRRIASQIPQSKKREYLLSLDEDGFRDKIVRPLFKELGYRDGRDTCGPMEDGRDAYFTQENALTGIEVTVVQTKVGNVTKSSVPSQNLDKIVTQMRTAANTPVLLVGKKTKTRPLRAFLVVSGAIKPSAIRYIVDELPETTLSFLDSEDIVPLVDRHMPELWLNITSAVMPYFRAVATALEQGQDILPGGYDVSPGSKQVASSADLFVDVLTFRPTKPTLPNARRRKQSETPKLSFLRVSSIIGEPERLILLTGEGGFGKTTALKRIVYEQAIKPVESEGSVRIPILMRAKDLAADQPESLIDYTDVVVKSLNPELAIPFSSDDLIGGRVIFMIDGLDEVTDEQALTKLLKLVETLHSDFPRVQIIVGSRPTPDITRLTRSAGFATFQLSALVGSQIEKLVTGHAKRHSLGAEYSSEVLRRLAQIHGVEMNPLIVTIFVATSDTTRGDFPANVTELFNKYTELMLGRWDESKGFHQQIQAPIKDFILKQIAFKMHEKRTTSIDAREFRSTLTDELTRRGFAEDSETLYSEIVERSGLFRAENGALEFKHHILQEYFAGRAIPGADFTIAKLSDPWWRNAIVFYFGAHPGDAETLKRLAALLEHQSGTERLMACAAVGLALQACYLSEIDDKREVYRNLLLTLADESTTRGAYGGTFDGYPFIGTLTYMFLMRESLSLSTLRHFADQLRVEIDSLAEGNHTAAERATFWLILGLIESGQPDLAAEYLVKFRPVTGEFMFSLFIDAMIALNSRSMPIPIAKELRSFMDDAAKRLRVRYPGSLDSVRTERIALEVTGSKALPKNAGSGDGTSIEVDEVENNT